MKGSRQFFAKWKAGIALVLVLVVAGTIHFTSLNRPQLSVVEELFRDLLMPFQTTLMRLNRSVGMVFATVSELGQLRTENIRLKEEVADLQQRVYELAEYRRENQWLREALDFKQDFTHELLVSEVIGRSPTNWLSSVTINRGSNHHVRQGMPVVSGNGIVGTVHNVSTRTATVVLSTDPLSAVGGLVQTTGDLVLVEGDPDHSGYLLARPLTRDSRLQEGDVVVTSGLSRLFPKGLPIGEVAYVVPGRYDLSFTAYIEPFVDMGRLEYVFVILTD